MYLGIDTVAGFVYEGLYAAEMPIVRSPSLSHAKLIDKQSDWNSLPTTVGHDSAIWDTRRVSPRAAPG